MKKKLLLTLSLGLLVPCSLSAETISQKRTNLRISLLKNIKDNNIDAAQADYNAFMKTFYDARQPQKSNFISYESRYETLKSNKNLQDKQSQMLLKQLRGAFLSGGSVEVREDESMSTTPTTPRGEPGRSTGGSSSPKVPTPPVTPRDNNQQQPTGGPGTPPPYPPRASTKPLPIPPRAMTQKDRDLKAIQDDYKKLQGLSGDPSKSTECNALKDKLDVAMANFEINYGNQDLKAADGTALKINNLCPAPRISPRPAPVPTPAPTPSPSSPSAPEPDSAIKALDAAAGAQKFADDYSLDDLVVNDFDPAKKNDAEQLWANIYSIYGKQTDAVIKAGMEGTLADLKQKYSLNVPDVN